MKKPTVGLIIEYYGSTHDVTELATKVPKSAREVQRTCIWGVLCSHMVNLKMKVQLVYCRCGCRMGSKEKGMCWFQTLVTEMGGPAQGCTMVDAGV